VEAGVSLAGTQLLPGTVAATEELAFQPGDYFELKTPPDVLPPNASEIAFHPGGISLA